MGCSAAVKVNIFVSLSVFGKWMENVTTHKSVSFITDVKKNHLPSLTLETIFIFFNIWHLLVNWEVVNFHTSDCDNLFAVVAILLSSSAVGSAVTH